MIIDVSVSQPSQWDIAYIVSCSLKTIFILTTTVHSPAVFLHLGKNTTELEEYLNKGNKDKCTEIEFQSRKL